MYYDNDKPSLQEKLYTTKVYKFFYKVFKLNKLRDYSPEEKLREKSDKWMKNFKDTTENWGDNLIKLDLPTSKLLKEGVPKDEKIFATMVACDIELPEYKED